MWDIFFWVWLIGFVSFTAAGALATIMDDEIDTKKIIWWKAALAYIFWPLSAIVLIAWAILDRMSNK